MKAFPCLNCIRGHSAQRLASSEPVRQVPVQVNAAKSVALPKKVSNQPLISKDGGDNDAKEVHERPQQESADTTSTPKPANNDPIPEAKTEHPASTSSCNHTQATTPSQQLPPILDPITRLTYYSSSSSSPSSHSDSQDSISISSLNQIPTAATTPPSSPTDTEAKPVRTSLEEKETLDLATSTPLPETSSPSASEGEVVSPPPYTAASHASGPGALSSATTIGTSSLSTTTRARRGEKSEKRRSLNTLRFFSISISASRKHSSYPQKQNQQQQSEAKSKHRSLPLQKSKSPAADEEGKTAERPSWHETEKRVCEEAAVQERLEGRKWDFDGGDDGGSLYCY